MEEKKSYQELLKEYTMTQNQIEAKTISRYTDLFLNELLRKRRVEQLRQEIDEALDRKDNELFLKLSSELIELMEVE